MTGSQIAKAARKARRLRKRAMRFEGARPGAMMTAFSPYNPFAKAYRKIERLAMCCREAA